MDIFVPPEGDFRRHFFERNNMEHTEQFQQEIAPFFWVNLDGGRASVCLNVGTYLQ